MHLAKVTRWGQGMGVIIPKALLRSLGVGRGDRVVIEQIEPGALRVRKLEVLPHERPARR